MRIALTAEGVVQSVDLAGGEAQDHVGRKACLQQIEDGADRQRRQQVASEPFARERRISYGRVVGLAHVGAGRAKRVATSADIGELPADV